MEEWEEEEKEEEREGEEEEKEEEEKIERNSAGSKDNFVAKGRTRFLERGEVQGHGGGRREVRIAITF